MSLFIAYIILGPKAKTCPLVSPPGGKLLFITQSVFIERVRFAFKKIAVHNTRIEKGTLLI